MAPPGSLRMQETSQPIYIGEYGVDGSIGSLENDMKSLSERKRNSNFGQS